ncbi:syntaxin-binding protein 5 [Topomyia yanbarensis]|uniref:syntaxin-binding protein 5 n=1 Tax=Topomyia yanbarensis TaxID=2498891 RepID=UPI00273B8530|nr:syntaxin-binding protein 5 [Topomyia yanbarensis]
MSMTFRHGFPYSPTALAYDPVQKVLAIGDKSGSIRILGKFGVDAHIRHEGETACAVNLIEFLVNQGFLVTATADDSLHLWDIHQKIPKVVQSLKFQRERITYLYLPVGTKWMYVGTEKGNTHIIHTDSFSLSGYIINWNKAIDPTRKTHPGSVIHLSDNPLDANKLLIGFETGQLVLWDMRGKAAELRWISQEPLLSCSWHHEGKHFISSHNDGSLCTWPLKLSTKPLVQGFPHAKTNKDGKAEMCHSIQKVEVKTNRLGEQFTIFSGGLPTEKCCNKSHCITVLVQSKSTTVLEMEHPVVDFITVCDSPWGSDLQEPNAVAVLLQNDLVLIDLLTSGYPTFESPYSMDIHESPVTCCTYLADCPTDLVPAFYSVGRNTSARRSGYSEREWPISGGEWQPTSCSYSEIVMTGHLDGSIKFWDSSAGTLQVLYKLKSSKVFEKVKLKSTDVVEDDPLSITAIALCAESRKLCLSINSGHVVLFKFRRAECTGDVSVLDVPISYENLVQLDSPDYEFIPKTLPKLNELEECEKKCNGMLKVKSGPQKKQPGFQAQLVCITPWTHGTHPGQITALTINSSYGLMAYGNEYGLAVIDIVQRTCLLNMSTQEVFTSFDIFPQTPRSPKRLESVQSKEDQIGSPSIDQINGICSLNNSATISCNGSTSSATTPISASSPIPNALHERGMSITSTGSPSKKPACNTTAMTGLPDTVRKSRSQDKLDESFSRSRSSSLSSLDNANIEAVTCLAFADSYIRKSDPSIALPTMWLGTSLGTVLTVSLSIPELDVRKSETVQSSLTGPMFRLKGSVLSMSLLDCNGALIPYPYETWRDDMKEGKEKREKTPNKSTANKLSPTNPDALCDRQFIVIASENQAGVFALPSQNCVYKKTIVDSDFVVKAEIISMKDSVCLIGYASNGHLLVFTLPSLKLLLDVNFLPLIELSFQTKCKQGMVDPMLSIWGQQLIVNEDSNLISKTFSFSNKGHGLYLVTPTEIQKFTVCQEFCNHYNEMLGELYIDHEMPEAPKESFFKGLFGGGTRNLDREELFGESSGKANKSIARHIGPNSNIQDLAMRATSASSEIGRAHQLMLERGDKLGQLEERTERMASEAQQFSNSANMLVNKYKDKKWYQL